MPWVPALTVLLTLLILIATIQLIAPGLGDSWFGASYAPDGWAYSQRWVYLLTEVIPVLCFAAIGALFWWLGQGNGMARGVFALYRVFTRCEEAIRDARHHQVALRRWR